MSLPPNEALIQCSRVSEAGRDDYVAVEIIRVADKESIIRLNMSLEEFAQMITGDAKVRCDVCRWEER